MKHFGFATILWARKLAIVFVLIVLFGVIVFYYREELRGNHTDDRIFDESIVDMRVARPLDGMLVDHVTSSTVFAVILDNAPEAWPQYGLTDAHVVWEFPVEGGRTRLMALFDGAAFQSDRIGPVRSVRPYFLDVAQSYGAYVVHVGGSPEALDMIAQGTIDALNEFYAGSYFWRDRQRYAPHNVLTSAEELLDAVHDRNVASSTFDGWLFDDIDPSSPYVSPSWDFGELSVEWVWQDDAYVRYVAGKPFVDASGETVDAQNVVVMHAPSRVVDASLRRQIMTVGVGDMVAFVAGHQIEGTWSRDDERDMIRFIDASGNEVVFNRGVTWIEVLPVGWQIYTEVRDE